MNNRRHYEPWYKASAERDHAIALAIAIALSIGLIVLSGIVLGALGG